MAAMIPIDQLKSATAKARSFGKKAQGLVNVRQDEQFPLWIFLRCVKVSKEEGGVAAALDVNRLQHDTDRRLGFGFKDDWEFESRVYQFPVQALYRIWATLGVSNRDIDAIRPFFNDESVRSRIKPLEVKRVVLSGTGSVFGKQRPVLSIPKRRDPNQEGR
jgi:hypothetical protein